MDSAFQPQIILLKEGTDTSQGKSQIVSNINACMAVAETIRTTLGPRGMDKLVYDGQKTTISNDGATIMRLLDIVHPAAKTLVDISMAQVGYIAYSSHVVGLQERSNNPFFPQCMCVCVYMCIGR
jgi:T-complex protein 1 subunit eta